MSDLLNVDLDKAIYHFNELKKYRGQFIDSLLHLEFFIDTIICIILFKNPLSPESSLFKDTILQDRLTFSSKLDFLAYTVKKRNTPKKEIALGFIEDLRGVNTFRNAMAHGKQSNALPKKGGTTPIIEVTNKNKTYKLSKQFLTSMNNTIGKCNDFLHSCAFGEHKNYFG